MNFIHLMIVYVKEISDWINQNKILPALVVVVTLIGVALSLISWCRKKLVVNISITTPTLILDSKNILSAQFEISNDGENTLRNVEFGYSIKKLTTSDGAAIDGDANFKNTLKFPNSPSNKKVANFKSGDRDTKQFPINLFVVGNNINYVDFAIKVTGNILFMKFERIFKFESVEDSGGKLHLKRISVGK